MDQRVWTGGTDRRRRRARLAPQDPRYVDADIVEDACVRIPLTRDAVGPDGTIADPAVRAQIAATLTTLVEDVAAREVEKQ